MTNAPPTAARRATPLDVTAIRQGFPLLRQTIHGKPLVYLDNASTTQKPREVIDRVTRFYTEENANVHRGVHWLSERATEAYEEARGTVARFLNARKPQEIVFVRGTTEAINLVAATCGRASVGRGDDVVVSAMEHHSNIVPWQILCEQTGARLRIIPITDAGELDLDAYERLLTDRTRIVSVVARLERVRHGESGRGDRSPRAPARHPGARGRGTSGRAHADRRTGDRV